jgi:hypothetical protein
MTIARKFGGALGLVLGAYFLRAGWYSWDRLAPKPGIWEVAALEPERFLGLRTAIDFRGRRIGSAGPSPQCSTALWGFLLVPLPGGRTRLVVIGVIALVIYTGTRPQPRK